VSQLVLITGASSGLGRALALHYAAQGCRLALVARHTDSISAWLDQDAIRQGRYQLYNVDVNQADAMADLAQRCIANQGLPELVIASAGISIGVDTSVRADLDVMARVIGTNVLGTAHTFGPFVAPMVARGSGSLVGIGSVGGIRGLPGHGAYSASKAAVITYCESLRGELRGSGVQVVTICPGYIATPLTQNNSYKMPFLMQADEFAAQAARAISRGTSYCVIPWQMAWVAKLLRLLPNTLFDKVFAGRPRKPRANSAVAPDQTQ